MRSKRNFALTLAVVVVSAAILAAPARAGGNCTALSGTIIGFYDVGLYEDLNPDFVGPGWYGWTYLTFGRDISTVYAAKLYDRNDGGKDHPFHVQKDGFDTNFAGYEILTFTIDGVGSFQVKGQFLCVAGATPYYCGFSEQGAIDPEAGTGLFAGMPGSVAIRGSGGFDPLPPTPGKPWAWVAQMTGTICTK